MNQPHGERDKGEMVSRSEKWQDELLKQNITLPTAHTNLLQNSTLKFYQISYIEMTMNHNIVTMTLTFQSKGGKSVGL